MKKTLMGIVAGLIFLSGPSAWAGWTPEVVDASANVGFYSDMALDTNGKVYFSFWDNTNGDLRYATNASGVWITLAVDTVGTVGAHSSIAVDAANKVHISYFDSANGDLKYATNVSGSFVLSLIDTVGTVGLDTSIAVDTNGKIHISYRDSGNAILKYATNASGSWVTDIADATVFVGEYSSIALDVNGKAYISYYDHATLDLRYVTNVSGTWVPTTVDSTGDVGQFTSIALDASGKAYISYYDVDNANLKYATNATGSWVLTTVDSTGDVGQYSSLALDAFGNAYISYCDGAPNNALKYATNSSGSWVTGSVDSGGDVTGNYSSIKTGANGKLHVGYRDGANGRLKYALFVPPLGGGEALVISPPNGSFGTIVTFTVSGMSSAHFGHTHTLFQTVDPDGANGYDVGLTGVVNGSGTWTTKITLGYDSPTGVNAFALRHDSESYLSGVTNLTIQTYWVEPFTVHNSVNGGFVPGVTITGFGSLYVTGSDQGVSVGLIAGSSQIIVAYKAGYTFQPAAYTLNNINSAILNISFIATGPTYSAGDFVVKNSADNSNLDGVTLFVNGANATNLGAGTGSVYVSLVADGHYTLTAQKPGFTFQPPSVVLTSLSANQTGLSFTGTATGGVTPTLMVSPTSISTPGVTITYIINGISNMNGLTITMYGDADSNGDGGDVQYQLDASPVTGVVSSGTFLATVTTSALGSPGVYYVVAKGPSEFKSSVVALTILGGGGGDPLIFTPSSVTVGNWFVASVSGISGREGVVLTLYHGVDSQGDGGDISIYDPEAGFGSGIPATATVTSGSVNLSFLVGSGSSFGPDQAAFRNDSVGYKSAMAIITIASGGGQGSFTISGAVNNSLGAPMEGVTLVVSGSLNLTMATLHSVFMMQFPTGTYTLTPLIEGVDIDPPYIVFAPLNSNQTNQVFVAGTDLTLIGDGGQGGGEVQSGVFSGTVRDHNFNPMQGVTISTGSHGSTLTSADGTYSITIPDGQSDNINAFKGGYYFNTNFNTNFFEIPASHMGGSNYDFTGFQEGGQGGGQNDPYSQNFTGPAPMGGMGLGTDGKGTIAMTPMEAVGADQQGTWTIVYTVPNEQLMPGGGVKFEMPWGWTDPQITSGTLAGFVQVTNSAGVNQTVTVTNNYGPTAVYVQFTLTLSAGTQITLVYGSTAVNAAGKAAAPSYGNSYNEFRVASDLDGVENGFDVGFKSFNQVFQYPPLNIAVLGAPSGIKFSTQQQTGLTLMVTQAVVQTADDYGNRGGNATTPMYVTLQAEAVDPVTKLPLGESTTMTLYTDAAGTQVVSGPLMITTGVSALTLYYKETVAGVSRIQATAQISGQYGEIISQPILDIVSLGSGISNVSIDTGTLGALTTVTLTPDGDGVDDFGFINFRLEQDADWQVLIDTNRDGIFAESFNWNVAGDMAFSGRGTENRVQFEARDQRMWRPLPNGTYPVRIALGSWGYDPTTGFGGFVAGSITNVAVSFVISSAGLTGTVYDNQGNRVERAQVNAGGASYGFAETDTLGHYTVSGLKAGEYHVNVRRSGFAEQNLEVTLSGTSDTSLNITLDKGGSLKVVAIRPSSQYTFEVWGGVEVHANNGAFGGYGPLHFTSGTTTLSDNGWYDIYDANNYKNYTEIGLGTGTYEVRLNGISGLGVARWMNGSETLSTNVQLSGLQITGAVDMTLTVHLDKRPSIQGIVKLTQAGFYQGYGSWVSVWAQPTNDPFNWERSSYGGVYFNEGTGTSAFELPGVGDGVYTVKARAEGFVEYTHAVGVTISGQTVSPASMTISQFSRGASITGVFAIPGNTMTQYVWLNVFSQNGGNGTSIQLTGASATYIIGGLATGTYELNTFLSGYEMDKFANGSHQVTISNGQDYVAQNITMTAFSGAISGEVRFPSDDASPAYQNIRVFVNQLFGGPEFGGGMGGGFENNTYTLKFENGKYTFYATGLGTGGYNINTMFQFDPNTPTKFYTSKNKAIRVENGKTATVLIELGDDVYDVSGTVTTKSTSARWNTIAKITANASREQLYHGGGSGKSLFRVVALPVNELGEGGGMGADFGSGQAGGLGFFGEIRPSTLDATVGEFLIPKLAPGAYKLFVPGQLSLSASTGGPRGGGKDQMTPDIISSEELVIVKDTALTDANLEIADGNKVSGTVSIPSAESQNFMVFVNVFSPSNRGFFRGTQLTMTSGGTSKTYSFEKLAPGKYTVQVFSEKYAQGAKSVEIIANDVTANIALTKGANVKGKFRDADSNTQITSQNAEQYLGGIQIYAQANPWVEGGWREAERTRSGGFQGGSYTISSSGFFSINNLPAGTYDVVIQVTPNPDQSKNKNYAPKVIAGVVVSDDDATNSVNKDIGTIDLKRGEEVKGRVIDKVTGLPLGNILVAAFPSNKGGFNTSVSTRTNADGYFTLLGLDADQQYYTVVASPRGQKFASDLRFDMFMRDAEKFGEARKDDIDISVPANRVDVNFSLVKANGSISGQVYTADGGVLTPVNMGGGGEGLQVGAKVFLQDLADFSSDDPLGDISSNSQPDGSFYLDGLVPGVIYQGRVMAQGYSIKLFRVTVGGAGTTAIPALTLAKGGKISGTILKPDATRPNTEQVGGVVAVTDDFSEILFGVVESDDTTKLVSGYTVDGLVPNTSYNLIVFPQSKNQSGPPDNMIDAGQVSVTLATQTKTVNIVYKSTAPTFIAQFQKSGNSMVLKFFSTQALRNSTTDDKDATKIVTVKAGTGTGSLTAHTISGDRRTVSAVYTPAAGETKFTINLKAYSNIKDALTNDYFLANEDFEFFLGFDGQGVENVNNLLGGDVKIAGDQSKASFGQGAFSGAKTAKVKVELYKVAATPNGAPRFAPGAYPVKAFKRFAKAPTLSGVFSNYYDVFLKNGTLAAGKSYSLAMAYDSSVTDTSNLNVYYLNETTNQWVKEETSRKVDTVNRTISVALNHASRFVVVNSNAATIGGTTYDGSTFTVFNYPNPFDLSSKTVTLSKAAGGSTATITGTEIRYTLPSTMTGDVSFQFYNLAGEKVRTLTETNKTGGFYYYVEWDGKNDDGSEVASGVYLCVAKANGATKTFKLAVVK